MVFVNSPLPQVPPPLTNIEAFNLEPLEEWRYIMGWNPFHFWQLSNNLIPVVDACSDLVRKYSWQAPLAAGRDDVAEAIRQAELRVAHYLHYSIAPHYVEENVEFERYFDTRLEQRGFRGVDGRWKGLPLHEQKIIKAGAEKLDLIDTAFITYSDSDHDGVNDTFTLMTVAQSAVTNPEDIDVYFEASDRLDSEGASDRWKIAPLRVVINQDTTISVTGRAWLLVRPVLYEGAVEKQIDPNVPANFAVTLEVYHHFCDPTGTDYTTSQAVLVWNTRPYPYYCYQGFPLNTSDPSSQAYATARVAENDFENGVIGIGQSVYDANTKQWVSEDPLNWIRPPDRVIVRYKAGLPLQQRRINAETRIVIARLAAAELVKAICACQDANREIYHWQFDMSYAGSRGGERYTVSQKDLENPLGMRRGHVQAWKWILSHQSPKGFAL